MKHIVEVNTIGCHILIVVSRFLFIEKKSKNYSNIIVSYADDPCELYCTDSEDTLIVPWGDSAADGTPCTIGRNDMCISGICRVSLSFLALHEYYRQLICKIIFILITESWL